MEDRIEGARFINLRISTGDPVYGLKLYNGLMLLKGKSHRMGEAEFRLEKVEMQKEGDWSKGYFKSLSPAVVERPSSKERNPKLRYALPIEEDFDIYLLENVLRRFVAIKGYKPEVRLFPLILRATKRKWSGTMVVI